MKFSKYWVGILFILIAFAACDNNEPEGGGVLPEHGHDLVANFVTESKKDDSGGRIVYIRDAPPQNDGERLWCVNVRYVNTTGVNTSAVLVSQRGEDWRVDRNPIRSDYEAYGCVWPVSDN